MRYTKTDELAFLREMREKIITENISLITRGTMLFHEAEVIVTDDLEEEFIPVDSKATIVDTEYAQELSWLFAQMKSGLNDTLLAFRKEEFFGLLADAANSFNARTNDRTGLLLAVLLEATMMVAQTRQQNCDLLKDEALACAASLSELAEKI